MGGNLVILEQLPEEKRHRVIAVSQTAFGFADLVDLLASTTDVGSNTEIQLDADDSVTLIGVQKADLHGDDFIF